MAYGPVNVPGMNALTLPWNSASVWNALSDHDFALGMFANLIRQNQWAAAEQIAALVRQDSTFQTTVNALAQKDTVFSADIAALQATDRTHTQNITELQTTAEETDSRLSDLYFAVSVNTVHATQLERVLMEERHKVTLENTLDFPFNSTLNTPVTIALDKARDNAEYSVEAEILSHDGPVGEIEVTAKARNGFKISYSGSGSSVNLLVKVKGGMS